jgi:hypothetical protein
VKRLALASYLCRFSFVVVRCDDTRRRIFDSRIILVPVQEESESEGPDQGS